MISNTDIITRIQADSLIAVRLEKALGGVKDAVIDQVNRMQLGTRRLAYYTSCFTDNYQDVCTGQKSEDVRFLEGLVQLVKLHNVVTRMLEIYVNQLLHGLTSDRIGRIKKLMVGKGATIAAGSMTSQALAYAIVAAVSYSLGARMSINTKLAKISASAVTIVSYYGYVQESADAANRLRARNPRYYYALYAEKLEMLYFIVESVISRNELRFSPPSSDRDIADVIMRMIR
ncbi:hypothetical protein [Erwinia tracheiphila]|uniref:Uncharacterized protein n=2 Tax=Erwinia tracheiphila TaxID=65700 RepID=A0A0M2KJF5_9GAMM|nr:hypothetical protein [Erwinia tracheiphila]EOS95386.1 hypothetical protein ETR_08581 [Erwinia tracheiphila PSU-1]KKF37141.1 hypothetical protein SY86_19790 [Erwinia tracheiphila]